MTVASIAAIEGLAELGPEFVRQLAAVVDRLGWTEEHADYLAATMRAESGLRPEAVNPSTGASGLIQWMPVTAKRLGTTVEQIRKLGAVEQLPLVEAYYRDFGAVAPRDIRVVTFLPNDSSGRPNAGKPDAAAATVQGEAAYGANAALDSNKDGTITVGEVRAAADGAVSAARARPRLVVESSRRWLWIAGALLGLGALGWWAWKEHSTRRRVRIVHNPTRRELKDLYRGICGPEKKERRVRYGAAARAIADRPCAEAIGRLRARDEQRRAKKSPKRSKAARRAMELRNERAEIVCREAAGVYVRDTEQPLLSEQAAARACRKRVNDFLRLEKQSKGKTHAYEFGVQYLLDAEQDLAAAEDARLERLLPREEEEEEEEAPF